MTAAEWIQAVSAVLVLTALILNILQLREVVRQSRALRQTLENTAYSSLIENQSDYYFRDDPELLAWFLSTRGLKCTSPEENKRRIFVFSRLENHEANYIRYSKGMLDEEIWTAWIRVIELDFRMPESREVWAITRGSFASSFAGFVDSIVAEVDRDVNKSAESSPEGVSEAQF